MSNKSVSSVLTWYLLKEFLIKFLLFLLVLVGVVYLFETIELLRRASGKDHLGFAQVLIMGLYKLPEVGQQILPFIILFSGMATLWSLTQRKELVCIRAAGLSVWQFLTPMIGMTLFIGLLYISILHPIAAASLNRYEVLENDYFNKNSKTVSIIENGLWLRQQDETGSLILNSQTLDADKWILKNVSVFFFDASNIHTQRIDAETALLQKNNWLFRNVQVQNPGGTPTILPELSLTTSLTSDSITESFSNPETISFWRLPHFIKALENTGLDTTAMKMYYQSLLAQPLILVAMICLAGAVSLRTSRFTHLLSVVVSGLIIGFGIFFLSGFLRALGIGHEIPVFMAAWAPPTIIILCAIATLMKLEDG